MKKKRANNVSMKRVRRGLKNVQNLEAERKRKVRLILKKYNVEKALSELGDPFDEISFHQKKKFALKFYFSHLKVWMK